MSVSLSEAEGDERRVGRHVADASVGAHLDPGPHVGLRLAVSAGVGVGMQNDWGRGRLGAPVSRDGR
jgi:hypothetical protein